MDHPRRKKCFFGPPPGTDMFYTVQYPDVFGVRRCQESVKPDFPLPGWEATVGKAGMVWARRWPRGGRSSRRDGIPNCAHPSGPKLSQVSPNARRRAQCKGGGGKEKKYMYTKKCQTLYNLQASLRKRRRNNYIEQKSRKHGKRESHRAAFLATISQLPKALYLQNISNFVSQVCCGRPRGGYVRRGCHASVLLTQRSAGKFAM